MLFSNLHSLLKRGVTINLIIVAAGDQRIEVTVLPSSEKSAAGTQLVAKTFVASPQELDEQFPGVMAGYASANLSLQDQLQALQKQTEAAAAAAEEAAKANAKKPAPKSTPSPVTKPATAARPSLMDEEDEIEGGDPGPCDGNNGCDIGGAAAPAAALPVQPDLISL